MDPRCIELDSAIEPIATGDFQPGPGQLAHLAHCRRCADALALARHVHRLLATMPLPAAPPSFGAMVDRRLRSEWWKTERHLDRWFNATVAAALVLVAAGILLLLNLSGLSAVLADASRLMVSGGHALATRVVEQMPVYAGAAALVLSALGIWWWAEDAATR